MGWIEQFPELLALDDIERSLLLTHGTVIHLPENQVVFGPGKKPDKFMLLLHGTVRIQKISGKGREIVLYRVNAGESCVMTTTCLLSNEQYTAQGLTETAIDAVGLSSHIFDQLLSQSAGFRHYVFAGYSKRIAALFEMVERVAFERVDVRLAEKLIELSHDGQVVYITHQQMAAELGTAREVISRQLAEFQRRQWVAQSRGVIQLNDKAALIKLAQL